MKTGQITKADIGKYAVAQGTYGFGFEAFQITNVTDDNVMNGRSRHAIRNVLGVYEDGNFAIGVCRIAKIKAREYDAARDRAYYDFKKSLKELFGDNIT